jgi:hypothetical protein
MCFHVVAFTMQTMQYYEEVGGRQISRCYPTITVDNRAFVSKHFLRRPKKQAPGEAGGMANFMNMRLDNIPGNYTQRTRTKKERAGKFRCTPLAMYLKRTKCSHLSCPVRNCVFVDAVKELEAHLKNVHAIDKDSEILKKFIDFVCKEAQN